MKIEFSILIGLIILLAMQGVRIFFLTINHYEEDLKQYPEKAKTRRTGGFIIINTTAFALCGLWLGRFWMILFGSILSLFMSFGLFQHYRKEETFAGEEERASYMRLHLYLLAALSASILLFSFLSVK